jgi:hypothetical protein
LAAAALLRVLLLLVSLRSEACSWRVLVAPQLPLLGWRTARAA